MKHSARGSVLPSVALGDNSLTGKPSTTVGSWREFWDGMIRQRERPARLLYCRGIQKFPWPRREHAESTGV